MWCPEGMYYCALIPTPTHVQDLVCLILLLQQFQTRGMNNIFIWYFVFVIIYLYLLSPSRVLTPYLTFIHCLFIIHSFITLSGLLSSTEYSSFHLLLSWILLQTKLMTSQLHSSIGQGAALLSQRPVRGSILGKRNFLQAFSS